MLATATRPAKAGKSIEELAAAVVAAAEEYLRATWDHGRSGCAIVTKEVVQEKHEALLLATQRLEVGKRELR